MFDFNAALQRALPYHDFLNQYGTDAHRARWAAVYDRIRLSDDKKRLLAGFQREMKVLVMAGTWCGDCVDQCPIFQHFAEAAPAIVLRFCDRDASPELQQELTICGGARVPAVVFLSEDGHEVGRYGDRTLAKYRKIAAEQLGDVCSAGIAPPGDTLLAATVQDWLNEFERAQLILRTSPRLRRKHGD
jgi:thiol-disulfide isomerase/thioredoxin